MKGEYSVKFEIDEPTKSDEGSYKFVVQNEKGETTSELMEVKEIPAEKGELEEFNEYDCLPLFMIGSIDSNNLLVSPLQFHQVSKRNQK